MEHLCVRCARFGIRSRYGSPSFAMSINARPFSTSNNLKDEKTDGDRRIPYQGRPRVGAKSFSNPNGSPRSGQDANLLSDTDANSGPTIRREVMGARPRGPSTSHFPRRLPSDGAGNQGQRQGAQRQSGQGGQKPSFQGGQRQGGQGPPITTLRRTGQGTGRLPSGRVQGGRFRRDNPRGGRGSDRQQGDRRVRMGRGRAKEDKENALDRDMLSIEGDADKYISECVDPPMNPTERIVYAPGQSISIEEFRKDWPNTPLSTTGLTETVQQRIEFMAHRLPHGYQTPHQLAERYRKGKFTRFESEEEKATVLKLAAEVSQQKADKRMEKSGKEVKVKDLELDDLSSRSDERSVLTDGYARGVYPGLEKQGRKFLDHVVLNLRNNETYNTLQGQEFLQALVTSITSQSQPAEGKQAPKTT